MKSVTKGLLMLVVLLGVSTSARAQQVTFQVDMSSAITNCAIKPGTDSVFVRGSFNDWGATKTLLTDTDGDKIYTGSITASAGTTLNYKFYAQLNGVRLNDANYEDGSDRSYAVTADANQAIPVATFNKTIANACTSTPQKVEIEFRVDMSVAKLGGFNPATDIVVVAGTMNNWTTTADTLQPDRRNPDIYVGVVRADEFLVPGELKYKYVIGKTPGTAPAGWESVSDRVYMVSGNLTDSDNNGYKEVYPPQVYFDNVTPADVFTTQTTITYEVDFRPAMYFLKDNNRLPSDTQTGDPVTTLTGLWGNGPFTGKSDGLTDWATWGPDLAAIGSRKFVDTGADGDATANDSVYTLRLTYPAGTPKNLKGKFSASGYDNEGGFGADHNFGLDQAAQSTGRVRVVFGAPRLDDGTYTDLKGPSGFERAYDPYICISGDSTAAPVVVRSGCQVSTGVERDVAAGIPVEAVVSSVAPNPVRGVARFSYGVPVAGRVSLAIYDMLGREVARLVDETQVAGTYDAAFDTSDLAAGVYVYRLTVGGRSATRTVVVAK